MNEQEVRDRQERIIQASRDADSKAFEDSLEGARKNIEDAIEAWRANPDPGDPESPSYSVGTSNANETTRILAIYLLRKMVAEGEHKSNCVYEEDLPDTKLVDPIRSPKVFAKDSPGTDEQTAAVWIAYREMARRFLYLQADRFIAEYCNWVGIDTLAGITERDVDVLYTIWRHGMDGF